MFRKPKSKSSTRQRIAAWDDNEEASSEKLLPKEEVKVAAARDPESPVSSIPPSLLSFDHDEGADDNFEIKKNKKYLKEQKRLKRIEERAAMEGSIKKEEVEEDEIPSQPEIVITLKPSAAAVKEEEPRTADEDASPSSGEGVRHKFSSTFDGIPDSHAVYEAKKRRERLRREGHSGFIPIDKDKKLRTKGERHRLVREDDNDDLEDNDDGKFYSRMQAIRGDEERRREDEMRFLEQENNESPDETDNWERQQIRKAVSHKAIGQLRNEYQQSSQMFRGYEDLDDKAEVGMDIDVDDEVLLMRNHSFPGDGIQTDKDAVLGFSDVLSRLKLRLSAREEAVNNRRSQLSSMERNLEENRESEERMRKALPRLEAKHKMLQKLKIFSACLIDCLQEKVEEVNGLSDELRRCRGEERDRLIRRRRRDVKDCYEECAAAAAGRPGRASDAAVRAADREARRARRRRAREGTLSAITHHDGLSSDDEEAPSQQIAMQEQIGKLQCDLLTVFSDTHSEYSSLQSVLAKLLEWLAVDEKSFNDAFVALCAPKLASVFIRQQLAASSLFTVSFTLSIPSSSRKKGSANLETMEWYKETLSLPEAVEGIPEEHPVVVALIPALVDKVVIPFITDVVREEWDSLSLRSTAAMASLLRPLVLSIPTLNQKSKSFRALLHAIVDRFNESIDEDLFVPMYSKQAIDNSATGCRAFLERQFWVTVKFLRCVRCLNGVLSEKAVASLLLSAATRSCLLCLQQLPGAECQVGVSAVLAELSSVLPYANSHQSRSLRLCFSRIVEQLDKNSETARELMKATASLDKKEKAAAVELD